MTKVVPVWNILFASDYGGGERNDSQTGHYFDTDGFIDAAIWLSDEDRKKIYENKAHKVTAG